MVRSPVAHYVGTGDSDLMRSMICANRSRLTVTSAICTTILWVGGPLPLPGDPEVYLEGQESRAIHTPQPGLYRSRWTYEHSTSDGY